MAEQKEGPHNSMDQICRVRCLVNDRHYFSGIHVQLQDLMYCIVFLVGSERVWNSAGKKADVEIELLKHKLEVGALSLENHVHYLNN